MTTPPTFKPGDTIQDPDLFQRARLRWPGHPVNSQMLADVAILENRPLRVAATRDVVALGMAEVARERQRAEQKAAEARDLATTMRRFPLPATPTKE
jgi:hypothetical protein